MNNLIDPPARDRETAAETQASPAESYEDRYKLLLEQATDTRVGARKWLRENTDQELLLVAPRIEALGIIHGALFTGIEDEKRRDPIIKEISAIGLELRERLSGLTPRTIEGFRALGRAIYRDRYGLDGTEISSEFDEELTEILIRGLAA